MGHLYYKRAAHPGPKQGKVSTRMWQIRNTDLLSKALSNKRREKCEGERESGREGESGGGRKGARKRERSGLNRRYSFLLG